LHDSPTAIEGFDISLLIQSVQQSIVSLAVLYARSLPSVSMIFTIEQTISCLIQEAGAFVLSLLLSRGE
jgi:hypothetical protein